MKKDLWAVICGNIRDELDFKLTLTKLITLRSNNKVSHILLSTWRGEIDKYTGLREALKSLDVFIVESYPISDKLQNTASDAVNFWRQSRQLLAALDVIPKDSFILRVRTDRSLNYINQMELLGVFDQYEVESIGFGKFPKLFQYKVFVFAPKMIRLMHMIDFVFLGYHKDLYKLINFDVNELMFQKQIVANAQWFMKPFIEEFPIIRDYMRFTVFKNTIQVLKKYVDEFKDDSIFPDVYYKVYAIYLLIMHTHFRILYMGKVDNKRVEDTSFHHFFSTSPGNNLYSTGLGTSIRNELVLEYAVQGKLKPSRSYTRFMDQVNALSAYGNSSDFDYSYSDLKNLQEFVNEKKYNEGNLVWYKNLKNKPFLVHNIYDKKYNINVLNCLSCDDFLWKELGNTFSLEKELWLKWLEIDKPSELTTEKMLLPIAKTGSEFSIYILLDLMYGGKITEVNISEVVRIVEFYLNIAITKKQVTSITIRIAFKYWKLVLLGKIVDEKINLKELFLSVLSRFEYAKNSEEYILILKEILDHDGIDVSDRYLLNSILLDMGEFSSVEFFDILNFYNEKKMLPEIKILNKYYIN